MGFWSYSFYRFWRTLLLYTRVFLSILPVIVVGLLTIILHLICARVLFAFVFYFCKGFTKISDGTHWVGMTTTLVMTGVSALLFNGQLQGQMLLLIALGNGIACGIVSIGACKAIGWMVEQLPKLKSWAQRPFKDVVRTWDKSNEMATPALEFFSTPIKRMKGPEGDFGL